MKFFGDLSPLCGGGSGGGSGKFATLKKSLFLVVMARDARAVLALVICI